MDLVIEGPGIRKHDEGGCTFSPEGSLSSTGFGTPWIQVSMDGHWSFYGDGVGEGHATACDHGSTPPLVRLDTVSSPRVRSRLEGTPTRYVWTPPLAAAAEIHRAQLSNRRVAFMSPKPHDRPHMVAYLAHECKSHRTAFFDALVKETSSRGAQERWGRRGVGGGVHGLGACSHNHRWSARHAYPPLDTPPAELYKDYRFVVAFENDFYEGYVTEKLVIALASGAVPIYFGDGEAAARVFDKRTYIDAREFFKFLRRADKKIAAEEKNKARQTKVDAAQRAALVAGLDEDVVKRVRAAAAALGSYREGGGGAAPMSLGAAAEEEEEDGEYSDAKITEKDWEALAAYVLDLDSDERRYNSYLLDDVFAWSGGAGVKMKKNKDGRGSAAAAASVLGGGGWSNNKYPHPFPLGDGEDEATLDGGRDDDDLGAFDIEEKKVEVEGEGEEDGVGVRDGSVLDVEIKVAVEALRSVVKPGGKTFVAAQHE